jgi:hypothetical protein
MTTFVAKLLFPTTFLLTVLTRVLGQDCLALGRPSEDGRTRLYTKGECDTLDGIHSSESDECFKKGGGSWSTVCAPLNAEDELTTMRALATMLNPKLPTWTGSGYPCQDNWEGITCDGNDRVIKIEITQKLVGDIAGVSLASFSLQGVTLLEEINLTGNKLIGPLLLWTSLVRLKVINLSSNRITGPLLPWPELGRLTTIDLSSNLISGNLLPWLDHVSLRYINLDDNKITGENILARYSISLYHII